MDQRARGGGRPLVGERQPTLHAPGTTPSQDASLVRAPADGEARRYEVRIDTLDRFLSAGYRGSFFLRRARMDVDAFEVDEHQIVGGRPYVNNFMFVAEG